MNAHAMFNNFMQQKFHLTISDIFSMRVAVFDGDVVAIHRMHRYIDAFKEIHGEQLASKVSEIIK